MNILSHVHGWTKKWMKNITRWTQYVHNQQLCVNPNSTCSQLRGMCQLKHHMFISKRYVPIRNWNNMKSHILYTISTYFLLEFNISSLLCIGAFLLLKKTNYVLSSFPPKLRSSIFSTITIRLQFLNIYFRMAKKTFTTMATPNTLETMIEYTLISSILDRIWKVIKTPLEYPRDPTLLDPFKQLLEIKTWGTKW